MSDKIELVLADCIDEIREGRMTVEECLERYPQLRQELSILLGTWQEISTAPQVTPSVEFQRTAKTRLQNRMLSSKPVTISRKFRYTWQTIMQPFRRRNAMRWITIALIAILLFVGSGAGVAYASEDALPGDALYSAKTTIEGVRLAFSDSDGDVELYNEFANTRVAEMQALAAAGRSEDMPAAAQGYENALNGMAKAMAEVASDSAARAEAHAALLEATHETRTAKLNELLGTVPEQAQQGIQRALDAGGPPDETGKRPEGKGKPENAGCPDNAGGPPDGKGKPEDVGGPPEDAGGPPEDAGPPEDSNAPDGAGPSDENGPPDDKGKPEDAGGPPDDKGKPDDCPSENRPEGGGGEGDETEEVEVEEEEEDED